MISLSLTRTVGRSLTAASFLLLMSSCKNEPSQQESGGNALAAAPTSVKKTKVINLDPKEFLAKRKELGGTLLDVRTPGEVAQGRIQGASVVDIRDPKFESKVDKIAKDKPVFVYCRSGGRSSRAAKILAKLGVTQVYNLDGGIGAWKGAGLATESSPRAHSHPPAASISPSDFDALIAKGAPVLVDFHTEWCTPCIEMVPIVEKLSKKHGSAAVFRVNIDESEELATREKISGVPVFVLYEQGKETFRYSGLMSFDELDGKLSAALKKE